MKRVTGIGGIFFQSESPEHLYDWYEKHLGIKREAHGQGATFEWRELQSPDGSQPGAKGATAWSIFPRSTKYFGASKAGFMVNYRVDDLDGLLEDLKKAGVEIDPHLAHLTAPSVKREPRLALRDVVTNRVNSVRYRTDPLYPVTPVEYLTDGLIRTYLGPF